MYGKLFASTFTGSMFGAGPHVFAVWAYIIANTGPDHHVELNPAYLGAVIGCSQDLVRQAIEYLQAADSESRSQECDGRRIVKVSNHRYFVVNHATYRAIGTSEERKAYFRDRQRGRRQGGDVQSRSSVFNDVQSCSSVFNDVQACSSVSNAVISIVTEAEADTEADTYIPPPIVPPLPGGETKRRSPPPFTPPSPEEVQAYLDSIGERRFTGEEFCDFYQAKGWMVGSNKMKDWRAAVRTWRRRDRAFSGQARGMTRPERASPPPADEVIVEDTVAVDDSGAEREVRIWRNRVTGKEIRRKWGAKLEVRDDRV